MDEGAQVRITDADGTVIALGSLDAGIARQPFEGVIGTSRCEFTFAVSDVPDDGGIEVTHRGVVQFTRDQASSIALTLGD